MEPLKVCLFGLPRLERDGQSLAFHRRRALALLAYLAMKKQPQSRDVLHNLIWSPFDRASAQNNLRRELSLLNSAFGEPLLATHRNRIVFNESVSIQIDVDEFLGHLHEAQFLPAPPDNPCLEYIDALAKAVALYKNDFLAGFSLPDSTAFDEWQFFEAESLRRACAAALQTLIECLIHQGMYDRALTYCQQWVALDPLHEPAQRQLMQVLAWAGEQAAAIRQYERFVQLLADELGIAPEETTINLYETIRARQLLPPSAAPRQDTRLAQPLHNLPAATTPFVGREPELDELDKLLANPEIRLITILAPGGMGKTRLMLEAAHHHLEHYTHGVYLVELGPLRDADDIIPALVDALRYDPPPDERSLKQQLLDYLKTRQLLLLMDNYEHLLAGAGVVDEILHAAPDIKILVTSRERLTMSAETVLELGGLDFPDWHTPDDVLTYSAGVLFNQSAQRVQPAFALSDSERHYVAQICQWTGGMPLGILLAASWVGTLSVPAIAEELQQGIAILEAELRDIPRRHHSIQAAFNTSWQRLAPAERAIMMQLSVFRGGFTREAIQRVTGASLRQLATLVNTAMLQRHADHERYSIHELLRQYAEDHLITQGQRDAAQAAHSQYYLDLMASLEVDLKGRRQVAALDQVAADLENVRAAWRYAVQQADHARIGQALESMCLFFDMRNLYQDGETLFRFAIEHFAASSDHNHQFQVSRIQTRRAVIMVAGKLTGRENVRELLELSLDMARDRQDHHEIGLCLARIGWAMWLFGMGTYHEAEDIMRESLTHFTIANDRFEIATIWSELGLLQCTEGKVDTGLQNLETAYQLSRETGNLHIMMYTLPPLGRYSADVELEESYYRESITISHRIGSVLAVTNAQYHLAELKLFAGHFDEARQIIAEALANADILDNAHLKAFLLSHLSILASVADKDYEQGKQLARECRTPLVEFHDAHRAYWYQLPFAIAAIGSQDYPAAREVFAQIVIASSSPRWVVMGVCVRAILLAYEGETERAVEFLALAFNQADHVTGWIKKWDLLIRLNAALEHELGADAYQAARERGTALDLDSVLV